MKFTGTIDINQPRDKVVAVFMDADKLKDWQEGFVKKELIKGNLGEADAVSMLYFQNGKRKMELQETIIRNELPDVFEAFYHHKHMDNTMKSSFIDLGENKTRYLTEVEYVRINWVMPKLIAVLFPSFYRKQVRKWAENFKKLLEKT